MLDCWISSISLTDGDVDGDPGPNGVSSQPRAKVNSTVLG